MIRIMMRGCNGKMGQCISRIVAEDPETEMVAGIDIFDDGHNPYPVFKDIRDCNVQADCLIDFSGVAGLEDMLDYCVEKNLP
ncbi:MAG: 4-hydroxy-tetrahydrodipicolinate reductase, partial [Lachnospiraceae bacterium]|nr:4-hydroxy-tetrahydrodipicolinate reductase [Lachnospiraceae bacterium]